MHVAHLGMDPGNHNVQFPAVGGGAQDHDGAGTIGREATSKRMRRHAGRVIGLILLALLLWWSFRGTEFEPARLAGSFTRARDILSQMWPPDRSVLPKALSSLAVTMQMAVLGTFFGFIGALPVSFLAARTPALPTVFSTAVKMALNVLRAIPSLVYAILFVYIVGLGPFTGALGIGVGSFVFMAKLFAEALESVHPAPIEAVKAVGGRPLQVFAYAMLPQAWPQFLSHTLYAWELNIGSATIVGIVGAGGIGYEMVTLIHYYQWPQACVYILVLVAMVLIADQVSFQIRKRYA